jgi:hypothetical protein
MKWQRGVVIRPWVVKTDDGIEHPFSNRELFRDGTIVERVQPGCRVWRRVDGGISWREPDAEDS